jgi:hypothetical protein
MKNIIVPPIALQFIDSSGHRCTLPPQVVNDISPRPKPAPPARRLTAWLFTMAAIVLLSVLVLWSIQQHKPVHALGNISQRITEPVTAPTPAIISRSAAAPRAVLVRLPVPRAQLVRLPEWKAGEQRELLMPYGLRTLGTYKGQLPSTGMLPSRGNQLGDTWAVGSNFWVWLTQPGATQASWIDP